MSAVLSSRSRSASASTSMPSMPSVPLISARPSFSASTTGLRPAAGERFTGVAKIAVSIANLAFAHHRQRDVRQRSEVTRATEAAVFVHDRSQLRVQQAGVRLGRLDLDPGPPGRKRRQPQQRERPDHLGLDLGARTGRVRPDQTALELGPELGRDVPRRQRPEAGGHAVVRGLRVRQRLDRSPRLRDLLERMVIDPHRRAVPRHRDDVSRTQRPDANYYLCCLHPPIAPRPHHSG